MRGTVTGKLWMRMPAVAAAVAAGEYGTLLRMARAAAGLTLEDLGRRAGYSTSTLSRIESGHRRSIPPDELRRLAEAYGVPVDLMGLSPKPEGAMTDSLKPRQDDEGGALMRRRDLLASAAAAATGAALAPLTAVPPAAAMASTLEDALFAPAGAAPLSQQQLAAQIAAAGADFHSCRYTELSRRLPRLLIRATATRDDAKAGTEAAAAGLLAQAYNVATDLMIKLHEDAMGWVTADRAAQAARASGNPVIIAESAALTTMVLRRARHRDGAQRHITQAAHELQATTGLATTGQTRLYARLLAVGGYTAAIRGDRPTAYALLAEAEAALRRAGSGSGHLTDVDLAVYKLSVARVLHDYGTAVDMARVVDPNRITSPERRARYWEDTALALHGCSRPKAAFLALLAAESDTPQEVRFRPWAQHLTADLLSRTGHSLPGLREFAGRVGVA